MNIKKVSDEEIIQFYTQKPIPMSVCEKKFHLCNVTISRALKRNNVHIWTRQELRQYDLRCDYFEDIDDEYKAYFLGLIFADGCVFQNKYKNNSLLFSIQLQELDGYIIEKLKELIKAPRKIVVDKRDNGKSITVINDKFVNNLISHGVAIHKPNRTLPKLNDEMKRHFIRGLFDGDGSFYRTNKFCLHICGHEYMKPLRNFLIQRLDLNSNKLRWEDNIWNVSWSGKKDILSFADYIYSDSHIFLNRKYQEFKKYGFV